MEVAGLVSALGFRYEEPIAGAGGRVTVNLTPRIAIDTRVTLFPSEMPRSFRDYGGKTLELFAGARGKFLVGRRFSFYGALLPGLLHATDTVTGVSGMSITTGSATHFALDMGTGVEFHVAPRWVAHAEWTGPLYTVRGAELGRSDPSPSGAVLVVTTPASVQTTWQFSTGAAYRIGRLPDNAVPPAPAGRWTAGPQLSYVSYMPTLGDDVAVTRSPAVGAFGSYRISRWLDADGSFAALSDQEKVHTPWGGGRVTQALGGVKMGIRQGRLGYFAKLRAGVQTHGAAFNGDAANGRPVFGRMATPAIDYGTVVEARTGGHMLLRFDAGDTMSFYRSRILLVRGERMPQGSRPATDSLSFSLGFGWTSSR